MLAASLLWVSGLAEAARAADEVEKPGRQNALVQEFRITSVLRQALDDHAQEREVVECVSMEPASPPYRARL